MFPAQYSEKLASVMKKILLVSEVGSLGRDFERYVTYNPDRTVRDLPLASAFGLNPGRLDTLMESMNEEASVGAKSRFTQSSAKADSVHIDRIIDPNERSPLTGSLSDAQKTRISQLLGE